MSRRCRRRRRLRRHCRRRRRRRRRLRRRGADVSPTPALAAQAWECLFRPPVPAAPSAANRGGSPALASQWAHFCGLPAPARAGEGRSSPVGVPGFDPLRTCREGGRTTAPPHRSAAAPPHRSSAAPRRHALGVPFRGVAQVASPPLGDWRTGPGRPAGTRSARPPWQYLLCTGIIAIVSPLSSSSSPSSSLSSSSSSSSSSQETRG